MPLLSFLVSIDEGLQVLHLGIKVRFCVAILFCSLFIMVFKNLKNSKPCINEALAISTL
jgi:hypothetical protein